MYRSSFEIHSTDVTLSRTLRLSTLFKLTQEATVIHTTQLGMGKDKTLDRGYLWVILKQCASINKLPEYGDNVILESWPGEMMHVLFPRYNRLLDEKGNVLCTVSAIWALIDINTRQMIIPEEKGIIVPGEHTGNEFDLPIGFKKIETSSSIELTVPFSYSDINGHLSNIHYIDIAEDCISSVAATKQPKFVHCEYNSEIKYKEIVTISYGNDGDRYYFSGDGDKHKFSLILDYSS